MKNKGFTLVEMLTIMVVLGIIVLITVPNIMGALNVSRDKAYENQIRMIEKAAENWMIDNPQQAVNSVDIETLKSEGYLSNNPQNPKTKEPITGCVKVIKESNKYKYEYSETC